MSWPLDATHTAVVTAFGTSDVEPAVALARQLTTTSVSSVSSQQPAGSVVDAVPDADAQFAGSVDGIAWSLAAATYWIECRDRGESLAITTTRNEHVDLINDRIQTERWHLLEIDRTRRASTADGIGALVGDLMATRRNDRSLVTSTGQFVRNRNQWVVTAIDGHGDITAARFAGGGVVVLPGEYARVIVGPAGAGKPSCVTQRPRLPTPVP